jgi:integrase
MRPTNVCDLTVSQIDRSDVVWCYMPGLHKTRYLGQTLAIAIGPRAQRLLEPFLDRPADAPLFSPKEAEEWRNAQKRANRRTPMTPSQAARSAASRERSRKRPPSEKYDFNSYYRAVQYGIKKANKKIIKENEKIPESQRKPVEELPLIPNWSPYQLRHLAGTETRRKYGLEGAQVLLGHKHADVTEIYAERDWELARKIALETG